MATIPTARSSYQQTDHIVLGSRKPFACDAIRASLNELSLEATRCQASTTQAAYLMRLNNIRRIIKSLS